MVVGDQLWCFGLLWLNGWLLVCRHLKVFFFFRSRFWLFKVENLFFHLGFEAKLGF